MKIAKDILDIIDAGSCEGGLFRLPNITLDRKIYLEVNKVLEFLGGKWDRKLKAHVFEEDIGDAIESVLLTGEVRDLKKEFQFFETPEDLAQELVDMAEVSPEMLCLEPSCGSGRILKILINHVGEENALGIDINFGYIKGLRSIGYCVMEADFMSVVPNMVYDRIVMNPPFTRQQDIDHVSHALKFLKPGGILASVMSAAIKFRTNTKTVSFIEELGTLCSSYSIKDLPEKSFSSSGTNVSTIVLKVVK